MTEIKENKLDLSKYSDLFDILDQDEYVYSSEVKNLLDDYYNARKEGNSEECKFVAKYENKLLILSDISTYCDLIPENLNLKEAKKYIYANNHYNNAVYFGISSNDPEMLTYATNCIKSITCNSDEGSVTTVKGVTMGYTIDDDFLNIISYSKKVSDFNVNKGYLYSVSRTVLNRLLENNPSLKFSGIEYAYIFNNRSVITDCAEEFKKLDTIYPIIEEHLVTKFPKDLAVYIMKFIVI